MLIERRGEIFDDFRKSILFALFGIGMTGPVPATGRRTACLAKVIFTLMFAMRKAREILSILITKWPNAPDSFFYF